jgi:hypothetical protein
MEGKTKSLQSRHRDAQQAGGAPADSRHVRPRRGSKGGGAPADSKSAPAGGRSAGRQQRARPRRASRGAERRQTVARRAERRQTHTAVHLLAAARAQQAAGLCVEVPPAGGGWAR